ncbi:peptide chain release factor 2 [Neorickettsia risticii]|uniref:peptide chain release factor 2 n=1 Tax=Neorickettsia risticii TaxID=950 RepID=UPI0011D17527|nr:peptide chain release factor 2 [Neorickettsia risticii]
MDFETQLALHGLKKSIEVIRRQLDIEKKHTRLEEIQALVDSPRLWEDQSRAQLLLKEKSQIETSLKEFRELSIQLDDLTEMIELASKDGEEGAMKDLERELLLLKEKIQKKEIECLFSGEADGNDCLLEIQSGAGGTESNDWAMMLLRMYTRWAEIYHKFQVQIVDKVEGEETGIKSCTLKVMGKNAYGWARTETGVHRLVRISPFDANAKRHTSFAKVFVSPCMEGEINISIDEKDLKIDTYRASGAGGQHVNKTESAVRITHLPSKIVVQSQSSRSQHQNKAEAIQMLKSRLYEIELRKKEEKVNAARNVEDSIGWGYQIRSYVLHPYQMIKDLRTGHEVGNITSVLDGDLDSFIIATISNNS